MLVNGWFILKQSNVNIVPPKWLLTSEPAFESALMTIKTYLYYFHENPSLLKIIEYISDKMGAQKKSKKSNESINARLALVMKSGKIVFISQIRNQL